MIEEALTEARKLAHENRLEGKDLDELAELEDDEDDDFLEQYRCVGFAFLTTTRPLPFLDNPAAKYSQTETDGRTLHH
jgi:hypothetical protein